MGTNLQFSSNELKTILDYCTHKVDRIERELAQTSSDDQGRKKYLDNEHKHYFGIIDKITAFIDNGGLNNSL